MHVRLHISQHLVLNLVTIIFHRIYVFKAIDTKAIFFLKIDKFNHEEGPQYWVSKEDKTIGEWMPSQNNPNFSEIHNKRVDHFLFIYSW